MLGRGDAEISLDGDWWRTASEEERRALLDHELHHIAPELNQNSQPITDDIGRPKIHMRKHDFQFGWFTIIAERHGLASAECIQAKGMMDAAGQYYWPGISK